MEGALVSGGNGVPNGSRTRVTGVRGQRPRPLDDGDVARKKDIVPWLHGFGQEYLLPGQSFRVAIWQ